MLIAKIVKKSLKQVNLSWYINWKQFPVNVPGYINWKIAPKSDELNIGNKANN